MLFLDLFCENDGLVIFKDFQLESNAVNIALQNPKHKANYTCVCVFPLKVSLLSLLFPASVPDSRLMHAMFGEA